MPIRFRFSWIPFLATAFAIAIGISAGQWQMRRAAEKEAAGQRLAERAALPPLVLTGVPVDTETAEYRKTVVRGEFLRDWPVYLDNRPHNGVAGFYLLMPLKIDGTDKHVMVLRGWFPRNPVDRTSLPQIDTPAGRVRIEGIIRKKPAQLLQLGRAPELRPGMIVQNVDVKAMAQAIRRDMHPFVIEQLSDTHDGLVREWPRPSLGIEKHLGYAFQWYALAAMALVFYVVTGFRRGTK